jgi:hypothetical protein
MWLVLQVVIKVEGKIGNGEQKFSFSSQGMKFV